MPVTLLELDRMFPPVSPIVLGKIIVKLTIIATLLLKCGLSAGTGIEIAMRLLGARDDMR
jgi:hypothetical protein